MDNVLSAVIPIRDSRLNFGTRDTVENLEASIRTYTIFESVRRNTVELPSSSIVVIKFTKSIARCPTYEGLNAVKRLFNNKELEKKKYELAEK